MDEFFSKKNCDRCGKELKSRIMSKMNEDVLCEECCNEEKMHSRYKEAVDKEHQEVKNGNYNYPGLFAGQEYPFR